MLHKELTMSFIFLCAFFKKTCTWRLYGTLKNMQKINTYNN